MPPPTIPIGRRPTGSFFRGGRGGGLTPLSPPGVCHYRHPMLLWQRKRRMLEEHVICGVMEGLADVHLGDGGEQRRRVVVLLQPH